MADELDGMATFVAVAEAKGFRAAADRLGVTHSAVSQAVRRLEGRLGVALVRRTTRSVHLTDAGDRLYAALRPALDEVRAAVADVGEMGNTPRGTLRLHSSRAAETIFGESLLSGFLTAYPHIQLDLVVSDAPVDIVADGYDAGIQLGGVIDKDMIAVPVTGDLRLVVVGSPSYFARREVPRHPRDLTQHECLNWHATAEAPPYRWEFTENGRDFSVTVPARVLSTDAALKPSSCHRGYRRHDGVQGARARCVGARRPRCGARKILRTIPRLLPLLSAASTCVSRIARADRSHTPLATQYTYR